MAFDSYMVDQIAVATFTGDANIDGLPSWSAPVVYAARIEEKTKVVRNADGTTVTVDTVIATRAFIGPRDRVWVPDFAGNNSKRVFPTPYTYVDANARTPKYRVNARRRDGRDGHTEVGL